MVVQCAKFLRIRYEILLFVLLTLGRKVELTCKICVDLVIYCENFYVLMFSFPHGPVLY